MSSFSGDTNNNNILETTETWTYKATHTVTQGEINAGTNLVNTASVDTDQTGPKHDDATTTVSQNPDFTIAKDATRRRWIAAGAGDQLHDRVAQHGQRRSDWCVGDGSVRGCGSLPFLSGDTNNDSILEMTETWTYKATHTVTQGEINAGTDLVNTAFVDTDQTGPKDDDATTTVTQTPDFSIAKDATESSVNRGGSGDPLHDRVAQHGQRDLDRCVGHGSVRGSGSPRSFSGDTNNDSILELTETWTYNATHTVTQARSTPAPTWSTRPRRHRPDGAEDRRRDHDGHADPGLHDRQGREKAS